MNAKEKKIVRKKIRTPKRKTEMSLTNRIRDAVNELKRYGSPETLREVNKIATPVSCPAYPIMQRYNETKKIQGETYIGEESPKIEFSSHGNNHPFSSLSLYQTMNKLGSYRKSPQQRPRRVTSLFQSKEMPVNLKSNPKNAMTSKNFGPGKYKVPNKSALRTPGNIHSSQHKVSVQVQNQNRKLSSTVNKKNPINHQKVTSVRYATVIPVHEMLNKQVHSKRPRRKTSKPLCPNCLRARGSTKPQDLKKKSPLKADTSSDQEHNTLAYYMSPPDLTRFPSSESAVKNNENKSLRKKKKLLIKPRRPGKPKSKNATRTRMEKTLGEVTWKKENIKAFRMVDDTKNAGHHARSFKLERKNPAGSVEGCSADSEVNYRMCKQCPLRQLISKIDPAVGQDKKSYPVVAFTCCRKAPNVKNASTST